MATKIDYYKNDASASIHEEGDGELWLAPSFTADEKSPTLFISVTDFETETEAGVLIPLPAVRWISNYLAAFITTADAAAGVGDDEADDRLGGSDE